MEPLASLFRNPDLHSAGHNKHSYHKAFVQLQKEVDKKYFLSTSIKYIHPHVELVCYLNLIQLMKEIEAFLE